MLTYAFLYNLCEVSSNGLSDKNIMSQCASDWNIGSHISRLKNTRIWFIHMTVILSQYIFKTLSQLFELNDGVFFVSINDTLKSLLNNICTIKQIDSENKISKIKEVTYYVCDSNKLVIFIRLNDGEIHTFSITDDLDSINKYNSNDKLMIEVCKILLIKSNYADESRYLRFISDYLDKPDYGKTFKESKDICSRS